MTIIGALDIETTGLDQTKGHRIIEVAVPLYELETEKLRGKFVARINPQRSIDPDAERVHGISLASLAAEPKWEDVAPKLIKVMNACSLLVAHNGNDFDFPFVGLELARIGLPVPTVNGFDTMVEARWATPMGKLPSLRELCFATGVEYDPEKAHAAEYDVEVMMQAFFNARRKGFFKIESVDKKEGSAK